MLPIDLHTHTVASGHGTTNTIADLAKTAYGKGMLLLGVSDHGPATPGSCQESYFRSLKSAPKNRAGVRILYGAEANILDEHGHLDISEPVLSGLDFCIASIHPQTFRSPAYHRFSFWDRRQVTEDTEEAKRYNTQAYIRAMERPYVNIIGHPDDPHYPIDFEQFVDAAMKNHVIIEVNEASLVPGGYRGDTKENMKAILQLCRQRHLPILLSSDSHGAKGVGEAPYAEALVKEATYPRELIVNYIEPDAVCALLKERR